MPDRVTEFLVRVDDREHDEAIGSALQARLGAAYEVETWREAQPTVSDSIKVRAVVVNFVAFVLLVIVVFGVMNTMLMSVLERTRQIGTMLALGLKRWQISLLFVMEALVLATLGVSLAFAVSRGVMGLVASRGGIPFAMPGADIIRYHLFLVPAANMVVLALAGSFVAAIVAAAYPAYKASRLRPVEALRAI